MSTFKGKKNSIEFLSFLLLCLCLCLVLLDDGWRLDLCVWIFIFSWKSPRVPFSLEGKRRRSAFVILSVDSLSVSQPRAASPSVSYQLRRGLCTSERPQCVAPEYIRINNKKKTYSVFLHNIIWWRVWDCWEFVHLCVRLYKALIFASMDLLLKLQLVNGLCARTLVVVVDFKGIALKKKTLAK